MKKILTRLVLATILLSIAIGCASVRPSIIKTYQETKSRGEVSILRLDASKGLTVMRCNDIPVQYGVKYILLTPGRHELWFNIYGSTLLVHYHMTNKMYADVIAGHTYILKSKGGGIMFVGNKWFPELIDVTDDPKLHLQTIPEEKSKK